MENIFQPQYKHKWLQCPFYKASGPHLGYYNALCPAFTRTLEIIKELHILVTDVDVLVLLVVCSGVVELMAEVVEFRGEV